MSEEEFVPLPEYPPSPGEYLPPEGPPPALPPPLAEGPPVPPPALPPLEAIGQVPEQPAVPTPAQLIGHTGVIQGAPELRRDPMRGHPGPIPGARPQGVAGHLVAADGSALLPNPTHPAPPVAPQAGSFAPTVSEFSHFPPPAPPQAAAPPPAPPPVAPRPPAPGPQAMGAPKAHPLDRLSASWGTKFQQAGIRPYETQGVIPMGLRQSIFGVFWKSGITKIELSYDHLQGDIWRYKVTCHRADKRTHEAYFRVREHPVSMGVANAACQMRGKPRLMSPTTNPQLFGPGETHGSIDDSARSAMYQEAGGYPMPGQPVVRAPTSEEMMGFQGGGAEGPQGFGDPSGIDISNEAFWEGGS